MTLGEKIKAARLESGLSQRQLCGDAITRNMLSQIEHGSANPSVSTLRYLAQQLGKPVSYFLQEQVADASNAQIMEQARLAYGRRDAAGVLQALADYCQPDGLFDQEQRYLFALAALDRAEQLLSDQEGEAAAALLERIDRGSIYYRADMERQRRQLLHLAYELLEQQFKLQGNFEKAYFYACQLRQLQR